MTKTPEEQQKHDNDTAECVQVINRMGKAFARLIMQQVLFHQDEDEIDKGVDAAVADWKAYLSENGVCENDVIVGADLLRQAILTEGKVLALALHIPANDNVGRFH